MITEEVLEAAQVLWDYLYLGAPLERCDCLLVLGSVDTRVAAWGAELYLQGWAPLMVMSGGLGRLSRHVTLEAEAVRFARIAREKGVPATAILIEDRSSNTGENILFTQQLLQKEGRDPNSFLLVQKPYGERRSVATFQQWWPGKKVVASSPPLSLKDYVTEALPMEKVINMLAGDVQRIRLYAEKGFQVAQPMPGAVWSAYEKLAALGFDEQLIVEP